MDIKQYADKGIVGLGNLCRIAKVMKKAADGKDITVGMIGGSITQGSLSSSPETCYAYLVYRWWANKFKDSKVTYINAGIGATTSQFGVARAESDLLSYNPDFVIVEFSVNDKNRAPFQETYEGLIRKILMSPSEPAILILNSVQYDDGASAQEIHNEIGRAYDLAMISMKDSLYAEVAAGRIVRGDITPDDLHPNDTGHKLVSEIVNYILEKIYDEVFSGEYHDSYRIQEQTVTPNRYMDSLRYDNRNIRPALKDFKTDFTKQEQITDIFRNGWKAANKGASIHFEVKGGMISVQYRRTVKRTAPIAKAVIDGDESSAVILDGNFDETWGDCLYLTDLLTGGEDRLHTLDIEIIEADEAGGIDFYLVSVIAADRTA